MTTTAIRSSAAIPESLQAPAFADANGGRSSETAPINISSVPSPSSANVKVPDNGRDFIGGGGGGVGGGGGGGGVGGGGGGGGVVGGSGLGGGIIKTGIAEPGEGPPKTVTLVGIDDIRTTPNSTPYKACE